MKNSVENLFDQIQDARTEPQFSKENPIDVLEEVSKLFYGIEYTTESELNKMVKKLVSKVPSNEIDMACLKLIDQNRIESIPLTDPLLTQKVNVLLTISPTLKYSNVFANEVKRALESSVYGVSVLLSHQVVPLRSTICQHIRDSNGTKTSLLVKYLTTATNIETTPFSEKRF